MTDEEGQTSEVNFYPRPPRGGRQALALKTAAGQEFLSTPSARRATHVYAVLCGDWKFLSTPSARRATAANVPEGGPLGISIHALREEGDFLRRNTKPQKQYFYPRPPRGGRRQNVIFYSCFQSISIHALREEGDFYFLAFLCTSIIISIHALREEGDDLAGTCGAHFVAFLSTPSARRATCSVTSRRVKK